MENKFTPGPWEIGWSTFQSGERHGIYAAGELDLKGYEIAVVNSLPTSSKFTDDEQGKANAKLIAAAPEMYEALKNIIAYEERCRSKGEPSISDHWFNQVKAAIKKATE